MNRKMVMAVVSRDQADQVLEALVSAGFGATFTESRGGVLRQSQLMLFVAADADKVESVLNLIRDHCHTDVAVSEQQALAGTGLEVPLSATTTTEVGYAVVFVWDLEQFHAF